MGNKLNFDYINKNNKKVSGAAAFNHYVFTEKGSIQAYNDEVGTEYVLEFIKQNSDICNESLNKKVHRNRLKVI